MARADRKTHKRQNGKRTKKMGGLKKKYGKHSMKGGLRVFGKNFGNVTSRIKAFGSSLTRNKMFTFEWANNEHTKIIMKTRGEKNVEGQYGYTATDKIFDLNSIVCWPIEQQSRKMLGKTLGQKNYWQYGYLSKFHVQSGVPLGFYYTPLGEKSLGPDQADPLGEGIQIPLNKYEKVQAEVDANMEAVKTEVYGPGDNADTGSLVSYNPEYAEKAKSIDNAANMALAQKSKEFLTKISPWKMTQFLYKITRLDVVELSNIKTITLDEAIKRRLLTNEVAAKWESLGIADAFTNYILPSIAGLIAVPLAAGAAGAVLASEILLYIVSALLSLATFVGMPVLINSILGKKAINENDYKYKSLVNYFYQRFNNNPAELTVLTTKGPNLIDLFKNAFKKNQRAAPAPGLAPTTDLALAPEVTPEPVFSPEGKNETAINWARFFACFSMTMSFNAIEWFKQLFGGKIHVDVKNLNLMVDDKLIEELLFNKKDVVFEQGDDDSRFSYHSTFSSGSNDSNDTIPSVDNPQLNPSSRPVSTQSYSSVRGIPSTFASNPNVLRGNQQSNPPIYAAGADKSSGDY